MPKKTAVLDYQKCNPEYCEKGVCAAVYVCQRKVLKQEMPFEQPDPPMMCVGCGTCVQACLGEAILLV